MMETAQRLEVNEGKASRARDKAHARALDLLIAAGWDGVPQSQLPDEAREAAERGGPVPVAPNRERRRAGKQAAKERVRAGVRAHWRARWRALGVDGEVGGGENAAS